MVALPSSRVVEGLCCPYLRVIDGYRVRTSLFLTVMSRGIYRYLGKVNPEFDLPETNIAFLLRELAIRQCIRTKNVAVFAIGLNNLRQLQQ